MPVRLATLLGLQAGTGVLLLARPSCVLRRTGHPDGAGPRAVLRLLGARQVLQAAGTAARPVPAVLAGGAAVDLLHALTAVGYAASGSSRRRLGLASAATAIACALVALACRGRHDGHRST